MFPKHVQLWTGYILTWSPVESVNLIRHKTGKKLLIKSIAQNTADIFFPDFLLINKSHPPTYGDDSTTAWSRKQVDDVKDGGWSDTAIETLPKMSPKPTKHMGQSSDILHSYLLSSPSWPDIWFWGGWECIVLSWDSRCKLHPPPTPLASASWWGITHPLPSPAQTHIY